MTDEAEDIGALPPRNHNMPPEVLPVLPPEPSAEEVSKAAVAWKTSDEPMPYDTDAVAGFSLRAMAFADACGKWRDLKVLSTQEQAEKLTDFVSGARAIVKMIDEARKRDKAVWDAKAKAVQSAYSPLLDIMDRAIESVKPLQADWLRRENARIAAEKAEKARIAAEKAAEAERLAAEAAARNDVAGEAEAERLRKEAEKESKAAARVDTAKAGSASGGGRTMALRVFKRAEIINQNQVYMHFRDHPAVAQVLLSLCNQAITSKNPAERNVPGIKIHEEERAA